MTYHKVCNKS